MGSLETMRSRGVLRDYGYVGSIETTGLCGAIETTGLCVVYKDYRFMWGL